LLAVDFYKKVVVPLIVKHFKTTKIKLYIFINKKELTHEYAELNPAQVECPPYRNQIVPLLFLLKPPITFDRTKKSCKVIC